MSEIDLNQMERLMAMMLDNDITELEYQVGDLKIELKRGSCTAYAAPATLPAAALVPPGQPIATTPVVAPADEHAGLSPISSPMVGTYYASPDPDSPPFVTHGAHVHKDTTVCVIEAMKVFNEIKAEIDGVIEKIAVKNGEAVEYGQPLFYVRPA